MIWHRACRTPLLLLAITTGHAPYLYHAMPQPTQRQTAANRTLQGTGVALITPFDENLQVDHGAFIKLLSKVAPSVDFLVIGGTTGESATVSIEEKRALVQTALEWRNKSLRGEIPIVLGLGGSNTAALLEEIATTDFTHIEAILSVTPYYIKPTQAALVAHYTALANACPVPVILYNVPSRTQANLSAETVGQLASHPNIIGLKEASPDLSEFIMKTRAADPAEFLFLSGDDALTPAMVAMGARGTIAVMPNVLPAIYTQVVAMALAGQMAESMALLRQLMPLNNLLYQEGNPVGIKAAVEALHQISARVRLPLTEASDGLKEKIRGVL